MRSDRRIDEMPGRWRRPKMAFDTKHGGAVLDKLRERRRQPRLLEVNGREPARQAPRRRHRVTQHFLGTQQRRASLWCAVAERALHDREQEAEPGEFLAEPVVKVATDVAALALARIEYSALELQPFGDVARDGHEPAQLATVEVAQKRL